ncbi:MAG: glyceraldehyde 3-phosphate dehydrogenase NAD-binding domain-containing protein, partial [Cryomorphaceae bacterium]
MEKVRIAINGFGRIGRTVTRVLQQHPELELIAINDLVGAANLAHLLKYDSVHGRFPAHIEATEAGFTIDGSFVAVLNEADPAAL